MKKIALIGSISCILFCCVGYSVYYLGVYSPRRAFTHNIITRLGGEGEIQKYCVEQRTGPIEMENGEKLPRYLSLQDIDRINKMCDCVVGKAYKTLGDPKIEKRLKGVALDEDMANFLKYALMSNYFVCEMEVQEMLNKRYKTIK